MANSSIEIYGSGIIRIVAYFKADNLPIPEFRNISDGFMVTILGKEKDDFTKDVGKDVGKELSGSIAEVFKIRKYITLQKKHRKKTSGS